MSHRAADLLIPLRRSPEFHYPENAFRQLRKHYAKLRDDAMVDLLNHEMERHERIRRKLELEREMTGHEGTDDTDG